VKKLLPKHIIRRDEYTVVDRVVGGVRQPRGWTTPTTTQHPSQSTTQHPSQSTTQRPSRATTQAIRPANAGLRAMPNKDHNRSLCLVQERLLLCEINYKKMDYETVLIIIFFKYLPNYFNFQICLVQKRICSFAK